ncbi:MAG: Stk1 family PASTA domain-containing Ser/Thr kinase [Phascolarctobacterium sp.]|nr:Stk1 family PASTA domain-containing Ser/Thr kinase [Phascolarctobacterium sp.]
MANEQKVLGGRYEIIRAIGYGGMAEVYLAHDNVLDRDVAVKILRDQYISDKTFVNQFEREAKSVARLTDPNIINVYDVVREDNKQYIVMEYVDGVTLKEFLEKNKPSLEETLEIISRAASGLGHAHRQNIIHCDVKPHNILIDKDLNPKIADFGISKTISSQTQIYSSEVMGSVHYLSPEQADGGRITCATDVYSLGVVLFEMLTGSVPFSGANIAQVTSMHLNKPVPRLSNYFENVPEGLQEIIDKALAKNSANRYTNGDEFAEALYDLIMKLFPDSEHHINLARREDLKSTDPYDDGGDGGKTQVVKHNLNGERKRPKLDDFGKTAPLTSLKGRDAENNNEGDDSLRQRKINYSRLMLLITGIIVAISMLANLYFNRDRKVVEVPQVVNMTLVEAQNKLQENDFKINLVEQFDTSKKFQPGTVMEQNPKPGEKRKEGSMITLIVSKGGEMKSVPNLVGMSVMKAENILTDLGFRVGTTTGRVEKDKNIGSVLEQSPRALEKLAVGSFINLVICEGSNPVPELKGKTLDEAKAMIVKAGLKLGEVDYVNDKAVKLNTIVSITPPAGTKLAEGGLVNLTVSKGGEKKSSIVEFVVPGKTNVSVSVVLIDGDDKQTLYSGTQKGGVRLRNKVSAGAGAKVQFYVNGKLAEEKSL